MIIVINFIIVLVGRFRQYDYGSVKNEKVYNSSQPPEYPIHKVDIPVAIFQGLNDILVTNQVSYKCASFLHFTKDYSTNRFYYILGY